MTNPMTTKGDIIVGGSSGTPSRLAIGTSGQILTSNGTTASWQTPSAGMTNPMTAQGDIIIGGVSGVPAKLNGPLSKQFLQGNQSSVTWSDIEGADIKSTGATDGYVLTADGSGNASWSQASGMSNPMTTAGDIIFSLSGGTPSRLAGALDSVHYLKFNSTSSAPEWSFIEGTDVKSTGVTSGKVLTTDGSGNASWQTPLSGGMSNPMTAYGDLIYGSDGSGTPGRLSASADRKFLRSYSTTLAWDNIDGIELKSHTAAGGSTNVSQGKTLLANGSGGVTWGNPKIYGHTITISDSGYSYTLRYVSSEVSSAITSFSDYYDAINDGTIVFMNGTAVTSSQVIQILQVYSIGASGVIGTKYVMYGGYVANTTSVQWVTPMSELGTLTNFSDTVRY